MNFDTLIIGAGQGGALARMLCEGGQCVVLIEKSELGGTCTNVGCTPTKAHIACAKRAHDARVSSAWGVGCSEVEVDLPAIVARTESIVREFRSHIEARLNALSTLEIVRGTAAFVDERSVEVSGQILSARNIVIATGAHAAKPEIEGLDDIDWLDHGALLKLEIVPEHLLILGGGYIACEFAQMFRRFGARVTIVQSGAQLLDREDPDVAQEVADLLRAEGVEIRLETKCERVSKHETGLEAQFQNGELVRASHLLLATGQQPNTRDLQIENANLKPGESGEIVVDEHLQAAPNIYALGDCKGGPAFTHIAYDDARILAKRLLHGELSSTKGRPVPYCVFTDPQIGRVGLNECEARERGLNFRVGKLAVCDTARGVESGEDRGFLKVLVGDDDRILGGAFIARDGGELIATLQTAMMGGLKFQDLRDGIWAHPTQIESLNRVFGELK